MKTLKDRVEYVLREYPETRNDDVELTVTLWRVFYPGRVLANEHGEVVRLSDLRVLPREDHVKRIRASFQNDPEMPQYLPTKESVAIKRQMNIETWRRILGYENARPTL